MAVAVQSEPLLCDRHHSGWLTYTFHTVSCLIGGFRFHTLNSIFTAVH